MLPNVSSLKSNCAIHLFLIHNLYWMWYLAPNLVLQNCEHLSGHPFTSSLNISNGFISTILQDSSEREGVDGREKERHGHDKRAKKCIPPSPFYPKFLCIFFNLFSFFNHAGFPKDLFFRSSNKAGQCNRRFKLQCFQ